MGILPMTLHKPETGMPENIKLIIEGKSKVGKTTFAASWPDVVLIECERGGADYVGCPVVDLTKGRDPLRGLQMAIDELSSDTRFKTVALDTIDAVAEFCARRICAEMGIKTISDAPKGARRGVQWTRYQNEITGIVAALIDLPKNIVILGHTKPATYDEAGKIKSEEGLDIYGKAARILYANIDNVGHMYAERQGASSVTMLSFTADVDCTRGCRHPALRDKEIVISRENGYQAFAALFGVQDQED